MWTLCHRCVHVDLCALCVLQPEEVVSVLYLSQNGRGAQAALGSAEHRARAGRHLGAEGEQTNPEGGKRKTRERRGRMSRDERERERLETERERERESERVSGRAAAIENTVSRKKGGRRGLPLHTSV